MKRRKMNLFLSFLLFSCLSYGNFGCQKDEPIILPPPPETLSVKFYLSTPDQTNQFSPQETGIDIAKDNNFQTINIHAEERYQQMQGFGYTMTGGSAMHLMKMSAGKRKAILTELFDPQEENAIGVSYLRLSIAASDLDEKVFSYNDLPEGQTDESMSHFSLKEDQRYLIPVLKEILEINPEIKFLSSPWSAPVWMKTNKASKGGSLLPVFYDAYALYLQRYVEEMAENGIDIDAITIQNEPLHPGNNPSMYMEAEDQAAFVKQSLGPAFERAGLKTKLIVYDHNADRMDYPMDILKDTEANKYVAGSAFHLYAGDINALEGLHAAFPQKSLYFTEQWVGAPGDFAADLQWHTQNVTIGASRNWCEVILEWNLAADANLEPHTEGGCDQCLGALTINGDQVSRNPAYYIIAHLSKFVRPGAYRINSNTSNKLPNVAFENEDGSVVLLVMNNSQEETHFNVAVGGESYVTSLLPGAVATYVF